MKIIPNYAIGNIYHRTNFNKPNFCAKYPRINEDYFEKNEVDPELCDSLREIYGKDCKDIDISNCIDDNTYTINFEIEDRPYRFHECCPGTEASVNNVYNRYKNLTQMVENIRKTTMGRFVRDGNREVFIPYILGRTPDVKRDEILVRNGNIANDYYDNFDDMREELGYILDKDIEPEEMATINYLSKTKKGFDNNIVKQAYGYYDKDNDLTYLYNPEKEKIQILHPNNYVKNIHLSIIE